MCGILGVVGAASDALTPEAVELLRHRGPDSEGRYSAGPLAMAMRRLAIIDLKTGDQPVSNEAGDVVCMVNGEIYNYVELRRDLVARGHVFRTDTDVEVVPHLYEEYGDACFSRLRGMFAVALWDDRRRLLLLARDRFGIKPLYVGDVDGSLAFASEIGALLALGVTARADLQALADFLSFGYVPGERTGLDAVRAVAPGAVLRWQDGATIETAFAAIEAEAADVAEVLAESVRLHLRSDVPLAVLLSGGLDSSLIAALAVAELGGVHTFTVGFGDAAFDELAPARAVADALGTDHHEVCVRADVAADLPEIVRRLEEPLADPSAIPLYYVSRATAAEVKVALAGEGGDEVFGGYSRYAWDRWAGVAGRVLPAGRIAGALAQLPGVAGRAASGDRKSVARRALKLLRHAELPTAERYFSWFALYGEDAKAEVLAEPARLPSARIFARLLDSAPRGLSSLGRLQYVDLHTMLRKDLLLKADRMSMAHSLELRVPFIDERVVGAGLALPDREKVRGVETKRILRRLVGERLPEEIARRPKQGFEVPIARWLREDLRDLAGDLLSPDRVRRRGIVDANVASRLFREHSTGERDHALRLYALIVLELWFDGVVERPGAAILSKTA